jgi:hypothetical protein
VPLSEVAAGGWARPDGLAEFEQRRARGAHVSRWHVRFGEAGCAALAAACWANGRGAAASLTWRGYVLGSWRELGRALRGLVAGGEDSRPGKGPPRCSWTGIRISLTNYADGHT